MVVPAYHMEKGINIHSAQRQSLMVSVSQDGTGSLEGQGGYRAE